MSWSSAQVQVCQCALAAEPGQMLLTGGNDATNHLVLTTGHAGSLVRVRTSDDLLGDRTAAGVKIDVEGAERLVLAGAHRALRERRISLLQPKWNQQSEALLDQTRALVDKLLRGYCYEFMRPDDDGRLLPANPSGYGPDLFAVPARNA